MMVKPKTNSRRRRSKTLRIPAWIGCCRTLRGVPGRCKRRLLVTVRVATRSRINALRCASMGGRIGAAGCGGSAGVRRPLPREGAAIVGRGREDFRRARLYDI